MIPKSLHTITALANVARYLAANDGAPMDADTAFYITCRAAAILGYTDRHADAYGLIDKAAAVIAKGAR